MSGAFFWSYCMSSEWVRKKYILWSVCHKTGEHIFDPKYIMKNIRFCSKSIFILKAIKGDGSKILIRCPTRLNFTVYQAVLEEDLQDMYADDSVFM